MLCQRCGQRTATVHLTKFINGQKSEMHLCEQCARETGELDFVIEPAFSLNQLLAGLLSQEPAPPTSEPGGEVRASERGLSRCPLCGLTYREFARTGRLGCSRCYSHFEDRLDPLLQRIHGHRRHVGKGPRRISNAAEVYAQIERLKAEMDQAIRVEAFERAAELRDKIKELESKLE